MKKFACAAALAAALLSGIPAFAADPCSAYKWDVSNEVRLFATPPTAVNAAATAPVPAISTGKHYALALLPQDTVQYATPPSKKMLSDGAFGGLLKFTVERAGAYRVAIDGGFWLDVVHEGKSLPALDFNGQRQCMGPHKIVVYELPAGTELLLQIAAASESMARLTVTPVAAPAP
jgi:hypothetical protein